MSPIWLLYLKSFRNDKQKKESSHFQKWQKVMEKEIKKVFYKVLYNFI